MLYETKKISWGSIIAGLVTVFAISIIFSTLGASLGFTVLSSELNDPLQGITTIEVVWTVVSILMSLAIGGFVCGKLAGTEGKIHGFLVWATTLVLSIIISSMMAFGAVKMVGNALGAVSTAASSVVSGIGGVPKDEMGNMAGLIRSTFASIELDTNLSPQPLTENVKQALQGSNIEALQPDYLQNQLNMSAKEVKQALKEIAFNLNDVEKVIDKLTNSLKQKADFLAKDVDRGSVVKAISSHNSELSEQEVNRLVNNYIQERGVLQQKVKQQIQDVSQALNDANMYYQSVKGKSKQQAEQASKLLAEAAWWSFISLLLGAVVSILAGGVGVLFCRGRRNNLG